MAKLATIIILTYNNLEYIKDCLNSILNQTYDNIELIISDDGSSDFQKNEIKDYLEIKNAGNVKKYQIIANAVNKGTVRNFNNAIKRSSGDLIIPLAVDDCFYDKNVVSNIVNFYNQNNSLVITGYRCIYDKKLCNYIEKTPTKNQVVIIKNKRMKLFNELCKKNFISGACTSYSKRLFKDYGYFDESYILMEDYPMYLKLSRLNIIIDFIDIPIIKYRVGGVSKSKKINPRLEQDNINVIKNEILPYRKEIQLFTYRLNEFKMLRGNNNLIDYVKYLDIVCYFIYLKIVSKLKSIFTL